MAYRRDSSEAFTGGSGQMVVMAELLHRKCNAAVPIVDIGTDVFAFLDHREEVARIQVKTAKAKPYKKRKGYSADFRIPIDQLKRTDSPSLFYALAVRLDDRWEKILLISRARLQQLREESVGTDIQNKRTGKLELRLYIQFRQTDQPDEEQAEPKERIEAFCGETELTEFVDAWESLPPLKPPVPIE